MEILVHTNIMISVVKQGDLYMLIVNGICTYSSKEKQNVMQEYYGLIDNYVESSDTIK